MLLDTDKNRPIATTAHWGTYYAEVENGKLTDLRDYEKDPSPSIIGQGILEALDDKVRVRRPMVRKGFLENGKSSNGKLRGKEPFDPWSAASAIPCLPAHDNTYYACRRNIPEKTH